MKTQQLKTFFLLILFICITSASVKAQSKEKRSQKPPTYEQLLEKMDANEDGKLSKAEIKGPLKRVFDEGDLNEDGFITKEEFAEMPMPQRGKRSAKKI